ncbi:ABC transporter substrate-binding protein [Alsobacter sp. SYSU M60028]|uniref:ABC transporter substrate-binding protein n=1 Tax=Alsobacter ponti TaxID=2962936 RepID=A0ABT1LA18_9HYPH|nr:ABC transporter substrate-binding protein [Alsobacter ponti]MCP8937946.1 ABC transporter substrate-binding protein [Alsobacter ponti]
MRQGIDRRSLMKLGAGAGALAALGVSADALAQAAAKGQLTMAFPADVPTWDPNARSLAAVQSLYKMVFDQPITQNPDITPKPALATKWGYVDDKGLALGLDLRSDVTFHDGSKMTAEDFKYSFFDRPRLPTPEGGRKLDTAFIWRRVKDIEIVSPTRVVMHFSEPMPSAVAWLYFLTSYVVPKAYLEKVGVAEFEKKPIGSGPYKLVEYQQGARIVLEANDAYWGGKPAIPRVTVELVRDPTARTAAIESKRVDVSVDVPIREAARLATVPGLTSMIEPISDITLLQITKNGGFADERVRLAAHHAINKEALSKAFFNGAAKPISVPAAHNTPGYPEDYSFAFSEDKAMALLKEVGHGPQNPIAIKFSSPNGAFPGDFDVARAIVQMWKKVGIAAELETIELSTYQERLRANTLPEATLFSWGNAAGDPEMYGGYLLDPKSIFSAMKSDDLGQKFQPLLVETDEKKRLEGYRAAHRFAAEKGYTIPLYQTVKTVVSQANVAIVKYDNGLVLPQTFSFKA